MTIDLNCDMGESTDDALERSLIWYVTSANIACGAHAGDAFTIERTLQLALRGKVAIGAHPGYPDRANFGRVEMPLTSHEIEKTVFEQVRRVAVVAGQFGGSLAHVKPHGALYNTAAKDPAVAEAIARGVAKWGKEVVLVGLAGSRMLEVWRACGFGVAAEGFADRRYEPDGSLRSRKFPDALISMPDEAAEQALTLARSGAVQTICIHSDTPGAARIAAQVSARLRAGGFKLKPFLHRRGAKNAEKTS